MSVSITKISIGDTVINDHGLADLLATALSNKGRVNMLDKYGYKSKIEKTAEGKHWILLERG